MMVFLALLSTALACPAARCAGQGEHAIPLIEVPAGTSYDEDPLKTFRVTRRFLMMKSEVTRGLYRQIMGNDPAIGRDCGPDCPVEVVTFVDAATMANKLSEHEGLTPAYAIDGKDVRWDRSANGYRLPTDSEWVLAARAGQRTVYAGGDDWREVAWLDPYAADKPRPVCSKKPNALGFCDMTGNVLEWIWGFDNDPRPQGTDPVSSDDGEMRIIRGHSFGTTPDYAMVARRSSYARDGRSRFIGFRLVRDAP